MSRFINAGIGLVNSITDAPRPPIEVVSATEEKAGFSLTNGSIANTELAVTLVGGQALINVNNGGYGYTDGSFTNRDLSADANDFSAAVNEQTAQGDADNGTGAPNPGTLTISYDVVDGQVTNLVVGNNVGSNTNSGDTFTINRGGGSADDDVLCRFMIP